MSFTNQAGAPRVKSSGLRKVPTQGHDVLYGERGDDEVRGGYGADLVAGGYGEDTLDGGPGADEIDARDGQKDTIAIRFGEGDVVYYDKEVDVFVVPASPQGSAGLTAGQAAKGRGRAPRGAFPGRPLRALRQGPGGA